MAIDWDRPTWGGHTTDSEWGTWLPEKTGRIDR